MSMSNIHRCKVFCHNIDPDQMELMGLDSETDRGKWLPFAFRIDAVSMCKMTSDDPDHPTFGCTSLFIDNGDTYIINTPFQVFENLFIGYVDDIEQEESTEDDMIL